MKEIDIDGYIGVPSDSVKLNATNKWYPSDSEENFPGAKRRYEVTTGKKFTWTENCITYDINSYGFRGKNFPEKPNEDSFLALGCSITFGVGLPEEQTWPYMLSSMLGIPSFNLGAPGMGYETSFRLLRHWWPKIRSKNIFMLVNPGVRREYFNTHATPPAFHSIAYWSKGYLTEHEFEMFVNQKEAKISKERALYAIKGFCYTHNLNFCAVETDINEFIPGLTDPLPIGPHHHTNDDVARDCLHPGPIFNETIAEYFTNRYGN